MLQATRKPLVQNKRCRPAQVSNAQDSGTNERDTSNKESSVKGKSTERENEQSTHPDPDLLVVSIHGQNLRERSGSKLCPIGLHQ